MASNKSTENWKISKKESYVAYALLALVVVLSFAGLKFASQLKSHYSISQFLPKDHPLLKADMETRQKFFLDQSQPVLIILEADRGDWLETARLKNLATATAELQKIEGTKSALSLGTVPAPAQSQDQLSVGTLADIASEAGRRERVKADRFLNPLLISEDGRRTLIVVSLPEDFSNASMQSLISQARTTLQRELPDVKVSIGGVPSIQIQLGELVKSELVRFMGLSLLACCLTLFLVFSSFWSLLIPLVAVFVTNILVLGFMSVAGISMTVVGVTIPILVSVSVLSLCIHTMLRYVEDAHRYKRDEKKKWAARLTDKAALVVGLLPTVCLANLFASLTTMAGFGTLLLLDVPIIREYGIAVACSEIIAFTTTTLVLTPLLALLPIPVARKWVLEEASWATPLLRHKRTLVITTLVGSIALAVVGRQLHWSARLFDDLPKREEARRATEDIDRSLGGTIPLEILVEKTGGNDPWNEPAALKSLDALASDLRQKPEVGSVVGLPELFRMSQGNPQAAIPETRGAIAEAWFMISMGESNPMKQFLTSDGKTVRLALRLRDIPSDRQQETMNEILQLTQKHFPDSKVSAGGMATTVHRLNDGLSRALLMGFWEALGMITVLLAFVFRSVRWTLMAALPNLVPAAVLVGILAWTKTPIKPGVALVFSIALGIAFNNTVYLLQRLRSLMKESGRGPDVEIERCLRLEGNPCFVASLCLLMGFATFLLSDFQINQTFGIYMLISLFFGLVGDLVFLPALIKWCPWILVSTANSSRETLESPIGLDNVHPFPVLEEPVMKANAPENRQENETKDYGPRAAAGIAAILTAFAVGSSAVAAPNLDANKILNNVEKGLLSKDEKATIKMKVVESNGSSKERELEIKRKSGDKHQILVRLKAPSDVSGIAVLSVVKGTSEDQWLYMPSQKKARRVVGGNKSQKILDTEFSVEDFSASTYAKFQNKVLKEERAPSAAVAVIESTGKGDASYSKILTWVDLANYQIQKSEYYDKEGKLLKTMVFRDYKKFGNVSRAQTVEVRNMQNQRSTILKIAGLKINAGLSDSEFTQNALEDEE